MRAASRPRLRPCSKPPDAGISRCLSPPGHPPDAILGRPQKVCQKCEDGFFAAWRRIAEDRFDFVFHYGDYVYERRVLRPNKRTGSPKRASASE
jgi:hypothetical protein